MKAPRNDGVEPDRSEGRGWLSSIDRLPDDADPDIAWALEELRAEKRPANLILSEFNKRLAAKGIDPIKKSAWGRWSVRKAKHFKRLDEGRAIANSLVPALGADGADNVTVLIAEMIKMASFEILEEGGLSAKGLAELSRALQATVNAQRGSDEYRRALEARLTKAADRMDSIARDANIAPDRIKQMREEFLGVRAKNDA